MGRARGGGIAGLVVEIVSVGAPNADLAAYEARLVRKMRGIAEVRLQELAVSRAREAAVRRAEEARRILRAAPAPFALLDVRGEEMTEDALRAWLARRPARFVIGGPDGVDAAVQEKAACVWRVSSLELSHALARALLVEQIFREAMRRIGHPYPR